MKRAELASAQREKKKSVTQKEWSFFAASWNWLYNNSTTSTREKNEKVKQFENLKSTRVASSTAHNIAQRRHTSEINWNSNSTSYWIVVMGSEWEKSEKEREKKKRNCGGIESFTRAQKFSSLFSPSPFLRNAFVTHPEEKKKRYRFYFYEFSLNKICCFFWKSLDSRLLNKEFLMSRKPLGKIAIKSTIKTFPPHPRTTPLSTPSRPQ